MTDDDIRRVVEDARARWSGQGISSLARDIFITTEALKAIAPASPVAETDAPIVTAPLTLPGLILSHRDHGTLFRDLPQVIKALFDHDGYRTKAGPDAATVERCARALWEYETPWARGAHNKAEADSAWEKIGPRGVYQEKVRIVLAASPITDTDRMAKMVEALRPFAECYVDCSAPDRIGLRMEPCDTIDARCTFTVGDLRRASAAYNAAVAAARTEGS
ncbi:MAG TPA: hypothetical protein VKR31_10230 [Rhizomicrobium sp.]|nr:hypothetical protein [Rhizomicrobium sp.]